MSKAPFDGKPVVEFSNGTDRRNFLRTAGLVGVGATLVAGGVSVAGASRVSASTSRAASQPEQSSDDIDILNYALTLEYLEADFYKTGLSHHLVTDRTLELVEPIAEHEQTHVDAIIELITTMGGTPVEKPTFVYPTLTFHNSIMFLRQAANFEELGVNAYHGQVSLISDPDVLGAAASIAGVESRHAAILATLNARRPFPDPLEEGKSMDEVVPEIERFIDDEEAGQ